MFLHSHFLNCDYVYAAIAEFLTCSLVKVCVGYDAVYLGEGSVTHHGAFSVFG